MKKILLYLLTAGLLIACGQAEEKEEKQVIEWQTFGAALFEEAKANNKFIVLDLKANWCHWCHVMDDSTYANPTVIATLNEAFIAVKTDQDANPELANRYRKYGWPATIIFSSTGEEVFKNAGYIEPAEFLRILDRVKNGEVINADEKPKKTYPNASPQALLEKRYYKSLDYKIGGANSNMKSISYPSFEYAMKHPSDSIKRWIDLSIYGAYNLVDPEFGGIYQYSTYRKWTHQHFEKLLARQARYIQIFCQDYQFRDRKSSLTKAIAIINYCNAYLKGTNPLFYSAQDADLIPGEHSEEYFKLSKAERLKKGMPKVDTNTYTNSNAYMINALVNLWICTADNNYLTQAINNYDYLKSNRKNSNLLYAHGAGKNETFALDDNLKILKANFDLYKVTQDKQYIDEAKKMIDTMMVLYQEGDLAISYLKNNGLPPQPIINENMEWCRLLNYAGHVLENNAYKTLAKAIHQNLLGKVLSGEIYREVELLTIQEELENEPLHAVIFYDGKIARQAATKAALHQLPFYIQIEAYPIGEVPSKIAARYGKIEVNTTFFCTATTCSAPLLSVKAIQDYLKAIKIG
ncbi:DUF255 domain-containing protein [Putridiphycobacter roseus]|nr:DUF255 domain-containing protein [Putridiphycobacter roseus]